MTNSCFYDNAIYNAALKKKYGMTTVTNNYKHLATMVAPMPNKTDAELEDWGIVIDADAVDADRATYEARMMAGRSLTEKQIEALLERAYIKVHKEHWLT